MLTGKMIHEMSIETGAVVTGTPWDELKPATRDMYNALANKLNAQLSKAGEVEKKIDFSPEMVQLLLDEAMIKGIERLLVHPEQEYTEEMMAMYLTDTLQLVADVLPEEMRLSVRRIVALYKRFLEEH